jgi:hypothetical protein
MSDFLQSNGTVAITARFTADPILPALDFVLHEAGLNLVPRLSLYNQVFQELLSPIHLLETNAGGVNAILLRVQDFTREVDDPEDTHELSPAKMALSERCPRSCSTSIGSYGLRRKHYGEGR